jgi:hypothetical protein
MFLSSVFSPVLSPFPRADAFSFTQLALSLSGASPAFDEVMFLSPPFHIVPLATFKYKVLARLLLELVKHTYYLLAFFI